MEDKVAAEVLKKILDTYPVDEQEKEALLTAIGLLAWTKLVEGSIKNMKRAKVRRENID